MSASQPLLDREHRQRAQTRQVRSAAAGCFVFLLFVACFIAGVAGLKWWLRAATSAFDRNTIVIARPEIHAHALIWIGLILLIAMVFALNARTWPRVLLRGGVVIGLGLLAVLFGFYQKFEAIRPSAGSSVELRYLWPRPSIVIDASRATVSHELDLAPAGETPGPLEYLVVQVDGATYRSVESGNIETAKRLLLFRGAHELR